MTHDPALDALFVPLAKSAIRLPSGRGTLFLRARLGDWIHAWPRERFLCAQTFRPFADALARSGAEVVDVPNARPGHGQGIDLGDRSDVLAGRQTFPLVLVLPPRQRDEARALLARAVRHASAGGIVVAAQANNEGAASVAADLARLAGPPERLSKHKCRVVWSALSAATVDAALVDEWAALDAPRPIAEARFVSRPGLFAWDRVDAASALLAALLPDTLAGRVADLGAGYGYLATEVVRRCAGVTAIDLYEAEQRALEPAQLNLARALRDRARGIVADFLWHDVTTGLPRRYDAIVSNPPFHQSRADQPELGQAFIVEAAKALQPDGVFWCVANRHLAYEATLAAHFGAVRTVEARDGFKVFEARGPRR